MSWVALPRFAASSEIGPDFSKKIKLQTNHVNKKCAPKFLLINETKKIHFKRQFFQNVTFESMHEISIFFAKSILLKHYGNGNKKNIQNTSQGPPNPGFMQKKVPKGDVLKKPLRELIF